MMAYSLVEFLVAAHLTGYIEDKEFPERGGIMLLSGPGSFKSTLIKTAFSPYKPGALVISDVNVETLNNLRPSMSAGSLKTIALPAFEKIYERNPQTANNVEGHIKGFIDEGYSVPSYMPQNMLGQMDSRCLVVGGLVTKIYEKKFKTWTDNGFHRRFLWMSFFLANPGLLLDAIETWQRIEFKNRAQVIPTTPIKMNVTGIESKQLRKMLEAQESPATPYALLKKTFCAMKWKMDSGEKAMAVMRDVATSFGQKATKLEL